jgi:hypothetical protein
MLLAACMMAVILWLARTLLAPTGGRAVSVFTLAALVTAGLASYGGSAALLGLGRLLRRAR